MKPTLPMFATLAIRRQPRSIARNRRHAILALVSAPASLVAALAIAEQRYPSVVGVKVRASGSDTFDLDVTVSSPYDTSARYADAFRATTLAGEVLGERKLLHDHQDEQPFTRDLYSVRIPRHIKVVVVQARDHKFGYGGKSVQVQLPGR